jgi:hypothetical protein
MSESGLIEPHEGTGPKITRGALEVVGGAIPFAGGLLSAAASAWSEHEQKKVNQFLKQWIKMLEDEIREKEKTVLEIMARLDMRDEKITERLESSEYQSLLKKTFREWSGAESEDKRAYIRNILANAAAAKLVSDDVVRLFIDWLAAYSELHFKVIAVNTNRLVFLAGRCGRSWVNLRFAKILRTQTSLSCWFVI